MRFLMVSMAVQWALAGAVRAADLPELPRAYVDTTYVAPTGNIITVNAGENLQTALNSAQLGDTIVLQAGATFTGNFALPNKTNGSGWIYIQSSAYSSLPAPGRRVSPGDAANMPKIVSPYGDHGTGVETVSGAHHYRFVGIECKPTTGTFLYNLIGIGNGETSTAALSHDITVDRCYIHGDPTAGSRRGVAMNGSSVAVIDSYVSDFKEAGADTQALWSYNSSGPLKIVNNYLEGAGENVMFGGADPSITNLVPSDIEIKRNYFFKPLSWTNSSWTVKNLLEFKNAQRVLVEGNILENNWPAAQNGMSILITPRNQEGTAPWSVTKDITIRLNSLVNGGQGLNLSGTDGNNPSQHSYRILIENNVLEVTDASGRVFQTTGGPTDLTINHNTAFSPGPLGFAENNPLADRFDFKNNLATVGSYGFCGTGTGQGLHTLNTWFTNWSFAANAIIGGNQTYYPPDNYFPVDASAVGFVNYAEGNYALTSSSPYKNLGTDGKDLGADIEAVNEATIGCVDGRWATPRGTPYGWMVRYGWRTNQDAIDEMDTDGDGMKTWQEYVAGTVPTNALSLFRIAGWQMGVTSDFVIGWSSITGKYYTIQGTTNLLLGFPEVVSNHIPATPATNNCAVPIGQANPRFYRVLVE